VVRQHLFVIFGATGDLTRRKLLPAFYRMQHSAPDKDQCLVLGVARERMSDEEFRLRAREALSEAFPNETEFLDWCSDCLAYQSIEDGYDALAARISELEAAHDLSGNRMFYLALPPRVFPSAMDGIRDSGIAEGPGWTRVVIEKPFGRDLESARELNGLIHSVFDESQVYRIDHYLGKETVQNLFVFRFANALFEGAWNRDRIEDVQITVAESLGVEKRAGYYNQAGAVRDMLQSHLTQLVALVGMEPPVKFDADAIRNEKVKVLSAIREIHPDDFVLGQYSAGDGMAGYRDEAGVPADSNTETAAAVRLSVDNWRWQGVPFILRTGKRFPERLTQIVVTFKEPPVSFFGEGPHVSPNQLVITLQPDEGFQLLFDIKAPGDGLVVETLPFAFSYAEAFGEIPDAYETLIHDVIIGDQTLFVRADEVEEAWRIYAPLLDSGIPVYHYEAGSWGPVQAVGMAGHHGWFQESHRRHSDTPA